MRIAFPRQEKKNFFFEKKKQKTFMSFFQNKIW